MAPSSPFISSETKQEFLAVVKRFKIDSPTARDLILDIKRRDSNNLRELARLWKDYLVLIGFDFDSYLEYVQKRSKDTSLEQIIIYHVYFFSIASVVVTLILKDKGVTNWNRWIKKQVFSPLLVTSSNDFIEEVTRQFANVQGLTTLVRATDVLKIIFEEIYPAWIRKLLGEFYTPDWLANLILQEYCVEENTIVDPSCGSGTFITKALRKKLLETTPSTARALLEVLDSIIGFDINFVTVQVARLNMLLALSDFLTEKIDSVVMPIYLADSICNPFFSESNRLDSYLDGETDERTRTVTIYGCRYSVPTQALDPLLHSFNLHSILSEMVSKDSPVSTVQKELLVGSFIAYKSTQRDLAVGNPPWQGWDEINPGYRQLLARQWRFLFTQNGWRAKITAGRVDLSALFVYSCHLSFLRDRGAKMAFVLPLSLFKSKSSAEGFRRFRSSRGPFKPTVVWDFSKLAIFPNASNKAVVAFFELGQSPSFPIEWLTYLPLETRRISSLISEKKLSEITRTNKMLAFPISKSKHDSPWVSVDAQTVDVIEKLEGKSPYRARGGINTGGANSIFWVEVLDRRNQFLRVRNIARTTKKEVKQIEVLVENEMVHPLIRGRNVSRWKYDHHMSIIVPYDPRGDPRKAIPEQTLKEKYPCCYGFFKSFENELRSRKEYVRWGARGPFYQLYRIGGYTFSPYKVIWPHMGITDQMRCCVLYDMTEGALLDQKVILVPFDGEDEAHYFCSVLNSELAFEFLHSYLILDVSTHILEHLNIPKFNSDNLLHLELAQLSKKCHSLVRKNLDCSLHEQRINKLVRKLWNVV